MTSPNALQFHDQPGGVDHHHGVQGKSERGVAQGRKHPWEPEGKTLHSEAPTLLDMTHHDTDTRHSDVDDAIRVPFSRRGPTRGVPRGI